MEDYRAGVVWAAVINSQGGIKDDPDGEARSVSPEEAFPALAEIFGNGKREERDDSDALIRALRGRGAIDRRERP